MSSHHPLKQNSNAVRKHKRGRRNRRQLLIPLVAKDDKEPLKRKMALAIPKIDSQTNKSNLEGKNSDDELKLLDVSQ